MPSGVPFENNARLEEITILYQLISDLTRNRKHIAQENTGAKYGLNEIAKFGFDEIRVRKDTGNTQ
jgi:hypothetical protein